MEQRDLLIDWSVLSYQAWFGMKSPKWEARTNIEVAEFARNLAMRAYYLKELIKPTKVIFAMDSYPIWRNRVYDDYYKKHTRYYHYNYRTVIDTAGGNVDAVDREIYLMEYDKKVYGCYFSEVKDSWVCDKLKKAKLEEIYTGECTVFVDGEPEDENEKSIEELPKEIYEFLPKYKGNRKDSKWDYTTTKKEYKELSKKVANNLIGLLGDDVEILYAEDAEADDIIARYVMQNTARSIYMYTVDTDLHQLICKNMFLKILKPISYDEVEVVDKSEKQVKYEVMHKILSGDSADNISGISLLDKKTCMGNKAAENYILRFEEEPEKLYPTLLEEADVEALERNLTLVYLDNIPAEVCKTIQNAFDNPIKPEVDITWESFGVDEQDLFPIRSKANQDSKNNLEGA